MLMRPLPVRALVTVGGAVEVDQLHPPANVVVERFAALGRATYDSPVITHAGRGTVMAAVSAGVPLVCVPIGRDQPAVAARVTQHGLGVTVEPRGQRGETAISHRTSTSRTRLPPGLSTDGTAVEPRISSSTNWRHSPAEPDRLEGNTGRSGRPGRTPSRAGGGQDGHATLHRSGARQQRRHHQQRHHQAQDGRERQLIKLHVYRDDSVRSAWRQRAERAFACRVARGGGQDRDFIEPRVGVLGEPGTDRVDVADKTHGPGRVLG